MTSLRNAKLKSTVALRTDKRKRPAPDEGRGPLWVVL